MTEKCHPELDSGSEWRNDDTKIKWRNDEDIISVKNFKVKILNLLSLKVMAQSRKDNILNLWDKLGIKISKILFKLPKGDGVLVKLHLLSIHHLVDNQIIDISPLKSSSNIKISILFFPHPILFPVVTS